MSRIFISYRREDSTWPTGRIYDRLANHFGRESIFIDVDRIAAGDNFQRCIGEAIGKCDILLTIIGQKWLHVKDDKGRRRIDNPDDWVRLEIEMALNRSDIRIIPVLLDEVTIPTAKDLPSTLQPLHHRHAASVRQDPYFTKDVDYIIDIIERHLEQAKLSEDEKVAQQLYKNAIVKCNNNRHYRK